MSSQYIIENNMVILLLLFLSFSSLPSEPVEPVFEIKKGYCDFICEEALIKIT